MTGFVTYETRLKGDFNWALREGSRHFENASLVHDTMRRTTRWLDEIGVDYAVVGAMAMFFHGYQRFTQDVDLLVEAKDVPSLLERLLQHGYVMAAIGTRSIREVETGVRIDFVVAERSPASVAEVVDGVRVASLAKLVELKLIRGITPGRLRHLADAQELIHVLKLPESLADQLHESVRSCYRDIWELVQTIPPDDWELAEMRNRNRPDDPG